MSNWEDRIPTIPEMPLPNAEFAPSTIAAARPRRPGGAVLLMVSLVALFLWASVFAVGFVCGWAAR